MGGFKVVYSEDEPEGHSESVWWPYRYRSRLGDGIWEGVMQFETFRWLLRQDLIDFHLTTEVEIDDRSKGDGLSKGIALLQITWFIIQLVARRFQGLTITELELTTAALAVPRPTVSGCSFLGQVGCTNEQESNEKVSSMYINMTDP